MNKEFTILKKDVFYEIKRIINNTAYLESSFGKNGLFNINTRQLIGDLDFYNTSFDEDGKFYFQEKTINENPNKDINNSLNTIRIYDALEEELLLDNWKIIYKFSNYNLFAVESPFDKKIHLFDIDTCRKDINIFYKPLDDVNLLYKQYNDILLVLTKGAKKGLFYHNHHRHISSVIEPIEFDSIERLSNVFVFQKNNQKFFIYANDLNNKSNTFDDITIDENNNDIIYCKDGKDISVYNTSERTLLLKVEAEKLRYIYNDSYKFYFDILKNGKHGLISYYDYRFSFDEKNLKKMKVLDAEYDEIKRIEGGFLIKQQDKFGFLILNSNNSQLIKPKYDKIEYLNGNYYAFYTNDYCDIGKVFPDIPYMPCITNCKIVDSNDGTFVYMKNNQYGILFIDSCYDKILPPVYDSCRHLKSYYYILEQNKKKGLFYYDENEIPIEYDDIIVGSPYRKENISRASTLYLSLKKGDKYKLAKLNEYNSIKYINKFNSIDFFNEFILLKDQKYSYMFSYVEDSPLIKRLPVDITITAYDSPYHNDFYNIYGYKKQLYCIDGKIYYIYNNKLQEIFIEKTDLYVAKYMTDTDIYEVCGYNLNSYNLLCSNIDNKNDLEAEKMLKKKKKKGVLEERYPALVLKKNKILENT